MLSILLKLFSFLFVCLSYVLFDLYVAAVVLMCNSLLILLIEAFFLKKTISNYDYIAVALIWVLGLLSFFFNNEIFIKLKPTFLFWFLGVFIGSLRFYLQGSFASKFFGHVFDLSNSQGFYFDFSLMSFYFLIGFLNLCFAYFLDTNTWFIFKFFGLPILNILFFIVMFRLLNLNLKSKV